MTDIITRFAPSPTGLLHLGHAHAALFAEREAEDVGGRFLLRIEDIDTTRCKREFDAAILEDLEWLGIRWSGPVLRQSERRPAYARALAALQAQGVLYPCFCTRKEIQAEIDSAIAAPHGAPSGPDGSLYPGTCRDMETDARAEKLAAGVGHALRLDAARAAGIVGALRFFDLDAGKTTVNPHLFGDAVIARKDIGTSYHLAVVVDDAHQGVSLVTRGADLAPATHLQRVLQGLLGLPAPTYRHHRLIADETGARFAKRADAASIKGLREAGLSPSEVRARAGFPD